MWRRRISTSSSVAGSAALGRFVHHTLSPLLSTNLNWKSLTAPLAFKRARKSKFCGHCSGNSRRMTA